MSATRDLLDWAEEAIRQSPHVRLWDPSDARAQAEALLDKACEGPALADGLPVDGLPADGLPTALAQTFRSLVYRRILGEPVALIVGYTEFLGLRLEVCPGVFLPRPTSGRVVRMAVTRLCQRPSPVFVDVATGIGPVALAVARSLPRARVEGLDISATAVAVAGENARRHGLTNVTFGESDLLNGLPAELAGLVDVISIHPPYFGQSQVGGLSAQARDFEPETSLTDHSADGLGLVRRLAVEAPGWLRPGGWLLVQIGAHLVGDVVGILADAGLRVTCTRPDSMAMGSVIAARSSSRRNGVRGR